MNSNTPTDSHKAGRNQLTGRVVVVSPHLDDAIMSLGASIARGVQAGASIEVLTAFAYIPSSTASAGPWDSSCGFATEGEAGSTRREEDRLACEAVGAAHRWLDFGAEPYKRRGTDSDIWAAVMAAARDADAVLIPGFPLTHPDHACLTELLLRRGLGAARIGFYAEQPYVFIQKAAPSASALAPPLKPVIAMPPVWTRLQVERAHRRAKLKAVRCYRSQLRHLGLGNIGLYRMLWRESADGGEAVAWLS